MAGTLSAEQLTKYILYCEWLIYATWRLQDSMSSLFQSVGASEKVFQLMLLPPSYQFLPKRRRPFRIILCCEYYFCICILDPFFIQLSVHTWALIDETI